MAGIIVVENGASRSSIEQLIESLRSMPFINAVYIGEDSTDVLQDGIGFVRNEENFSESMLKSLELLGEEYVLIVDARLNPSAKQMAQALEHFSSFDSEIGLFGYSSGDFFEEFTEFTAGGITELIASSNAWPTAMAAAKSSFLRPALSLAVPTLSEVIMMAAISALGSGERVESSICTITLAEENAELIEEILQPAGEARARLLRHTVNSVNIEELYPNHAWGSHGGESAAASYHSLSALFINLEDMESAIECLALGDQLEDSPRSLALKGFIALRKGQTLEAVANMVSSLQEYEKRKQDEAHAHYLTFKPMDLEVVNSKLQSGLDALNKRDNDTALGHFADAVFNFDPFYSEYGLDRMKTRMN